MRLRSRPLATTTTTTTAATVLLSALAPQGPLCAHFLEGGGFVFLHSHSRGGRQGSQGLGLADGIGAVTSRRGHWRPF